MAASQVASCGKADWRRGGIYWKRVNGPGPRAGRVGQGQCESRRPSANGRNATVAVVLEPHVHSSISRLDGLALYCTVLYCTVRQSVTLYCTDALCGAKLARLFRAVLPCAAQLGPAFSVGQRTARAHFIVVIASHRLASHNTLRLLPTTTRADTLKNAFPDAFARARKLTAAHSAPLQHTHSNFSLDSL